MRRSIIAIVSFVTGVILTIFVYQAITIYQLRKTVATDHVALTEVVNFLNTQLGGAQTAPAGASTNPPAAN